MTKEHIIEQMLDNFFINSLKDKYRIVARPQKDGSMKYSLYPNEGKRAISHTIIREDDIDLIFNHIDEYDETEKGQEI